MCIEAGEYNPSDPASVLYKCDFYQSLEAGESLMRMLETGQSQPWQKTLQEMIGEGKS